MTTTNFTARNIKTGAILRAATEAETAACVAGQTHHMFGKTIKPALFAHPVVVGDVAVWMTDASPADGMDEFSASTQWAF